MQGSHTLGGLTIGLLGLIVAVSVAVAITASSGTSTSGHTTPGASRSVGEIGDHHHDRDDWDDGDRSGHGGSDGHGDSDRNDFEHD
jgi:hypothetical protein